MRFHRIIAPALALCLTAAAALANTTSYWTQAGIPQFYKGNFDGAALTSDGEITLGSKTETVFSTTEPYLWSLAYDSKGTLWAGSGNKAILYRIGPDNKSDEAAILPGAGISSIAVDGKNNVYAAVFPGGEIYILRPGGKAESFARVPASYIWDMKFGPGGALYCVTGSIAAAFKISPDGKNVRLLYASGERHFLSMFLDGDKFLYTGTSPNALVLRINIKEAEKGYAPPPPTIPPSENKGDMNLGPEEDQGTIEGETWPGMESATPEIKPQPAKEPEPAPDPRITVLVDLEEDEAFRLLPWDDGWFLVAANRDQNPPQAQQQPPIRPMRPEPLSFQIPPTSPPGRPLEAARMYLVNPDGQTRKILEIPDPAILSLHPLGENKVLVGTGNDGRIYLMNVKEDTASLQEIPASQVLAIAGNGNALRIAIGNPGSIIALTSQPLESGAFESSINDASTPAVYGNLDALVNVPPKSSVEFRTRTGNTPNPKDGTWSGWSEPEGRWPFKITSPPGRYIQFQAALQPTPDGVTPEIREVRIYYLTANQQPVFDNLTVLPAPQARTPTAPPANPTPPQPAAAPPQQGSPSTPPTPPRMPQQTAIGPPETNLIVGTISTSDQITIQWIASDPDRDTLRFTLYFRQLPSENWTLLEKKFYGSPYTWNIDSVPDGRYEVKVAASDIESNPENRALTADETTDPFIIDRSRPKVTINTLKKESDGYYTVTGKAVDTTSIISGIEYSLDNLEWRIIFPEDGLFDSDEEEFTFEFKPDGPAPHLLLIRARDFVGNTGSESKAF